MIHLTFSRDKLLSAVKSVVASTKPEEIELCFNDGKLTISNNAKGRDISTTTLPIHFGGKSEIRLNPTYLLDVLQIAETELIMHLPDQAKVLDPIVITTGENYKYVVMPRSWD